MSHRFQVTLSAELESLSNFRDFIVKCCTKFNVQNEVVLELKLSVDEACTNIIQHGYKGMDPGSIILTFRIEAERILVQITDFGHIFEPVETDQPDINVDIDEKELGGFGLYLIYQTMDNIDYLASPEGNTLTFTKFLNPQKE
jgi:anti-sigma regulatory factor (Ser/Thr protein kinase)